MANNLSIIITPLSPLPPLLPPDYIQSLGRPFVPAVIPPAPRFRGEGKIQLDESFFFPLSLFSPARLSLWRSHTLPLSFISGSLRCRSLCSFCCCVVLTRGGVSSTPEHQRAIALRLLLSLSLLLLFLFVCLF